MSLYGYTTRADLTRLGSFLMMGLFGIIIAGLVNMFMRQRGPAVRDQRDRRAGVRRADRLRHAADQGRLRAVRSTRYGPEMAAKRSVYDSLQLLLNFINLFMLLLQLLGNRSSSN